MSKYKLTKETKEVFGIKLYRIEALIDFGDVEKGQKGGWIEKEENLSQEGNCWVSGNAMVYGDARISGNAWVSGNAMVYGDARVYGTAWVYGDAEVYDNAWVYGTAEVYGTARVYGNAWVYGELKLVSGNFYHHKEKSETIEKIDMGDYEILCSNPKFGEEEKPQGKKVKIRVADGQILEGEVVED